MSVLSRLRGDDGFTMTLPMVAIGGAGAALVLGTLSFTGAIGAGAGSSAVLSAVLSNPCMLSTTFDGGLGDAAPTADQATIIAAFKQRAFEMGLGLNGALMATYVAHAESGVTNSTIGDKNENGEMSTSRGVFQQLEGWAGPTAWSGHTPPAGMRAGDYFVTENAWGPNGWATRDRRMDPSITVKWFYGSLITRLKERGITPEAFSRMVLTDDFMLDLNWDVQRWERRNPIVVENNLNSIAPARALFAQHAGAPVTVQASTTSGTALSSGDGIWLLGDSLMQGVATMGAPDTAFGGEVTASTDIGVSAKTVAGRLAGPWKATLKDAPSKVAVSLGTNSPGSERQFAQDIDDIMAALGPSRTVYWTTLHTPATVVYNKTLTAATGRWSNLKLVDIQAMVEARPGYIEGDGVHLTGDGYKAMWDEIAATIGGAGSGGITIMHDPCANGVEGGLTAPQTIVGADGCPVEVADNALRDTASTIGATRLCQEAVAGAPTPQAALAIKWAMTHLGIPYACWDTNGIYEGGRQFGPETYFKQTAARAGPYAYDCSSWVGEAYAAGAGLNTRGHNTGSMLRGASGYESIAYTARMPGDLIITETGEGASGRHVKMYLGRIGGTEYVAHTNNCGDVSKVEPYFGEGGDPILNVARPIPTTKGEEERLSSAISGLTV